jgi:hypothetical protein
MMIGIAHKIRPRIESAQHQYESNNMEETFVTQITKAATVFFGDVLY